MFPNRRHRAQSIDSSGLSSEDIAVTLHSVARVHHAERCVVVALEPVCASGGPVATPVCLWSMPHGMSLDLVVRSLVAWSVDDTLAACSGSAGSENTLTDNMLGAKAFPDEHGDYSA
eukprot:15037776-Alexandrium_andersonii.AAC.1